MFKANWKRLGLAMGLSLTLFAAGCGSNNDDGANNNANASGGDNDTNTEENNDDNSGNDATASEEGESIELVYVLWDTEVASTHVIGKVLEDEGYDVTLTSIDNAFMWQSVANGEADRMVAAWLPATHGDLYEEYKD